MTQCILYLLLLLCYAEAAPLISSPWGKIQGVTQTSPTGKTYNAYYAIPYALPPTGKLRFRPPSPHPGVTEVWQATQYGPVCSQQGFGLGILTIPSSEDCLTLGVHVPTPGGSGKSVMVWIHGGSFKTGGAPLYEPWKLVTEEDVIVVVVQYRLGVFGFLSTGNAEAPGNFGLLDQVLALEWVQKNIGSFGGDPDSVTIVGESAGSASVSLHTLSPVSKGLFKRAIMQSGAATAYWANDKKYREKLDQISSAVNCSGMATDKQTVACLRGLPAGVLLKATDPMDSGPVVDGNFMRGDPATLIQNVTYLTDLGFYDMDALVGVNNNEGGLLLENARSSDARDNTSTAETLNSTYVYDKTLIPNILKSTYGQYDAILAAVISYEYTSPRTENQKTLDINDVLHTYGDVSFVAPAVAYARRHSDNRKHGGRGKTYFYYFNHYPSFSAGSGTQGMYHAFDLPYMFGLSSTSVSLFGLFGPITKDEQTLSNTFVNFLTAFAKTGNPSSAVQLPLGGTWKQFDVQDEAYISFTTNMTLEHHLQAKRVSFWLHLMPELFQLERAKLTAPGIGHQGTDMLVG
ncbi:cholinesterase 2-like [Haliotis rufescens]|uniref:cholinesterase 2-like n=1 Tax=Haliotis rufescens TaxID=6454 RepID=UPI001EB050C4|nr:cholinesterase 2-like [Haliotis rufescens]